MRVTRHQKSLSVAVAFIAFLCVGCWLLYSLRPAGEAEAPAQRFEVAAGEGFRDIARRLEAEGLIRSSTAFQAYILFTERSRQLKPGVYALRADESATDIAEILAAGAEVDAAVTIPEGLTAREIDRILSQAGITKAGEFLVLVQAQEEPVEGYLFPDTYRFYFDSDPQQVLEKFLENFDRKAAPLLAADPEGAKRNLILASLLEKEVPTFEDRKIVAGLLLKRFETGMPLQVDATLCYIKAERGLGAECYPLTVTDKEIESPYNTYLHRGWPPTPIGNPGLDAIRAALEPQDSLYWYYLSDPETRKTIFSETLEEHAGNRKKYLLTGE